MAANKFVPDKQTQKAAVGFRFVHHKGGTGKTTSCLSVAGWLARMKKKVLVVDLDPQGNATAGLGIDRNTIDSSIYDVPFGQKKIQEIILETDSGVFLAPSSLDLLSAETHLAGHQTKEKIPISEAQFRELIEKYLNIIIILDRQKIVRFVNSIAESLYGWSQEKLLGEKFSFPIVLNKIIEIEITRKSGKIAIAQMRAVKIYWQDEDAYLVMLQDITEHRRAEEELENLIKELTEALHKINTLKGLLPICANCKKIRDDKGYWNNVESYITDHADIKFTHSLCPDCLKKLYPEYVSRGKKQRY